MKKLNIYFVLVLILIFFSGCEFQKIDAKAKYDPNYVPKHYIISKADSNNPEISAYFQTEIIEVNNDKIISGNVTSDICKIHLGQETPSCNLKFDIITYDKLKQEVDKHYELLKEYNQTRDLYWNEKDFIKIYENKKGCKYNLCYENNIITAFTLEHAASSTTITVWKVEVLEE